MMQLREQGISEVSKVKEAHIESDGQISVIESKENHHQKWEKRMVKTDPIFNSGWVLIELQMLNSMLFYKYLTEDS